MVQFLNEQKDILKNNDIHLVSTGMTGTKVEKAGFEVTKFKSGPLSGDAHIAVRAAEGK